MSVPDSSMDRHHRHARRTPDSSPAVAVIIPVRNAAMIVTTGSDGAATAVATLPRTGTANVGGRQQAVGSSLFTRAVPSHKRPCSEQATPMTVREAQRCGP